MDLKLISIFKCFMAVTSHQTSGSVAKWSQGFPEPYFCLLPWAAGAALSHFLTSSSIGIPEQGILPQQAEDAEDVMEGSVAHSALRKGCLVSEFRVLGKMGEMGCAFPPAVMQ